MPILRTSAWALKPRVLVSFNSHGLLEDLFKEIAHADFTGIGLSFEPSALVRFDPDTQLRMTVFRLSTGSWAASAMSRFFNPSCWHQQKRNRFHVQNSSCQV